MQKARGHSKGAMPRPPEPPPCAPAPSVSLSPFSVDKSVNSAAFPFPDNDLPQMPIRQAFPPSPSIRRTAIAPFAPSRAVFRSPEPHAFNIFTQNNENIVHFPSSSVIFRDIQNMPAKRHPFFRMKHAYVTKNCPICCYHKNRPRHTFGKPVHSDTPTS